MSASRRSTWSLGSRLAVWFTISGFVIVLGTAGLLDRAFVHNLDLMDDLFLADQVHVIRMLLNSRPDDLVGLQQEAEWESSARRFTKVYVRVLDGDGVPIVETEGMRREVPAGAFPPPIGNDAEPQVGFDVRPDGDRPYRVMAALASLRGSSEATREIQVALDRNREEDLLARYRTRLLIVSALALLACAVVGRRIASRGMRPIREISEASRRIGSANLHERIETDGLPAELSELARTFDEMLDRLENEFQRLSRFSADIAHELRTPLNNLRGEAEVALGKARSAEDYRAVLESSLEEYTRLSRMIDSLLFLARAESPEAHVTRERLDVARELEAIREFYDASAHEAGVRLRCDATGAGSADLDRTLFQRAIGNLLENALAHTPAEGEVTLSARREDGVLRVRVSDTGRGIPEVHLPHVFDRLYRVDPSRPTTPGGAGLGLAIVKSIVELHGGSVSIASEAGHGTSVALEFPLGEPGGAVPTLMPRA